MRRWIRRAHLQPRALRPERSAGLYLALGSNGENRSLTEEEKLAVLATIVRHKGPGQVVMAGLSAYDAHMRDTERFL